MEAMNKNCLEGLACPQCKSEGPFFIDGTATFVVCDDGTDSHSEVSWENESGCSCQCGCSGNVGDFKEPLATERVSLDKPFLQESMEAFHGSAEDLANSLPAGDPLVRMLRSVANEVECRLRLGVLILDV
jgi:hypothetical protein